jgi:hypothetical protein
MASGQAPPDDDESDASVASSLRGRPINLIDIARVLGESANVERLGQSAPIRAWRDDLTLIQESLTYALTILAADVEILTIASSPEAMGQKADSDPHPGPPAVSPQEDLPSEPSELDLDLLDLALDLDDDLFIRADHLLAPHQEMARVDLSSAGARARVLELVEEQLAILTERQAAVEARLQQIKAAIMRRYREGAAPARDQPA